MGGGAVTTPVELTAHILGRMQDALNVAGRPVKVAQIAVGAFVLPDCCQGVLTVAIERSYLSTAPFPTEPDPYRPCNPPYMAHEILVRVDRCIPLPTGMSTVPDPAKMQAAYDGLYTDSQVVWNTWRTPEMRVLGDGYDELEIAKPASQEYPGEEGGCIAVETRFIVGTLAALWCPETAG